MASEHFKICYLMIPKCKHLALKVVRPAIVAENTGNAFFIRIGQRVGGRAAGSIRNIRIRRKTATWRAIPIMPKRSQR